MRHIITQNINLGKKGLDGSRICLGCMAYGSTYPSDDIEDMVFVPLTFPNKILAHFHASWLDPSKRLQMTIVGTQKMIVYEDVDAEPRLKIYDQGVYRHGADFGECQFNVHRGALAIPGIEMSEPLRNECAHFVECIREDKTPRTDGESGLRVIRVLQAAQESLAKIGVVTGIR